MKLNDVKRFSAYVRTIYHSEYITLCSVKMDTAQLQPCNETQCFVFSELTYYRL